MLENLFTDPVKSMSLSREIFANIMKKDLIIYANRKRLINAQATGEASKVIDVVKKILI